MSYWIETGNGVPLRQQAQLAIAGGATAIQLRDKEMKGRDYYQAALVIKDVCKENNVLFIVNDRLDVALAAEADGVHLGQEDCHKNGSSNVGRKTLPFFPH